MGLPADSHKKERIDAVKGTSTIDFAQARYKQDAEAAGVGSSCLVHVGMDAGQDLYTSACGHKTLPDLSGVTTRFGNDG